MLGSSPHDTYPTWRPSLVLFVLRYLVPHIGTPFIWTWSVISILVYTLALPMSRYWLLSSILRPHPCVEQTHLHGPSPLLQQTHLWTHTACHPTHATGWFTTQIALPTHWPLPPPLIQTRHGHHFLFEVAQLVAPFVCPHRRPLPHTAPRCCAAH